MKLTKTMQKALQFANDHGDKLVRYPGGFWRQENWKPDSWSNSNGGQYFGTSTIEALVSRGVMSYSKWQEGRDRTFPIEVKVNA